MTRQKIKGLLIAISMTLANFSGTAKATEGHSSASEVPRSQRVPVEVIKPRYDNRHYQLIRLDNGLEALLIADPDTTESAAALTVNAGSFQDPEAFPGLAHYIEHLLYLNTASNEQDISLKTFLEQNGGKNNATTYNNRTSYFFSIANDKFEQAIQLMGEHLATPTFQEEYLQEEDIKTSQQYKEITAIHQEWLGYKSKLWFALSQTIRATANPQHPLSRFAVGNRDTLTAGTNRETGRALDEFYKRYYVAKNMKLVVVSKQSVETLQTLVETHFSSLSEQQHDIKPFEVAAFGELQLLKDIQVSHENARDLLTLHFPIQNNTQYWRNKPNHYLWQLLSSKDEHALVTTLQKAGLISDARFYIEPAVHEESGEFKANFQLTTQGKQEFNRIIATFFHYLQKIAQQGLRKARVQEFSDRIARDYRSFRSYDPLKTARRYSRDMFDYPISNIINRDFEFNFSAEAIQHLLAQLTPDNMRLVRVSNDPLQGLPVPYADGLYNMREITPQELQTWLNAPLNVALPAINDIVFEQPKVVRAQYLTSPKQILNGDGVYAWLMHACCYRGEFGFIQVEINSAAPTSSVDNFVAAHIVNNIYRKRTQSYVEQQANTHKLGIQNFNDIYANTTITLAGNTQHHAEIASRLLSEFVTLTFSEEEVRTEIKPYIESMESALLAGSEAMLGDTISGTMGLFPGAWSYTERREALLRLTRDRVVAMHQTILKQSVLKIFAHSNYSEQDIARLGASLADILRGETEVQPWHHQPSYQPQKANERRITLESNKGGNVLSQQFVAVEQSLFHEGAFALLERIYAPAFFEQMRTEQQLGYKVFARAKNVHQYPSFELNILSHNTLAEELLVRVGEFNNNFLAELTELSEAEFEELKEGYLKDMTALPKNLRDEAYRYSLSARTGRYIETEDRVSAILSISKQDLLEIYESAILNRQGETLTILISQTEAVN